MKLLKEFGGVWKLKHAKKTLQALQLGSLLVSSHRSVFCDDLFKLPKVVPQTVHKTRLLA